MIFNILDFSQIHTSKIILRHLLLSERDGNKKWKMQDEYRTFVGKLLQGKGGCYGVLPCERTPFQHWINQPFWHFVFFLACPRQLYRNCNNARNRFSSLLTGLQLLDHVHPLNWQGILNKFEPPEEMRKRQESKERRTNEREGRERSKKKKESSEKEGKYLSTYLAVMRKLEWTEIRCLCLFECNNVK